MEKRGIILTNFGNFDSQCNNMVRRLRDEGIPIKVYCDHNYICYGAEICRVNGYWKGEKRYGHRNSDLWRIRGMLESRWDIVCYLDLDMEIVSGLWKEGFELAARFGLCLPINPRSFVGIDSFEGADSDRFGLPHTATAYNMSPIFAALKVNDCRTTLSAYCREMITRPARGPAVMYRAVKITRIIPYVLAPEWCAHEIRTCFSGRKKIEPIITHRQLMEAV